MSQAWSWVSVVSATQEVEAGESLEPGRWRLQWAGISPLHPSLGDRTRLHLKKKGKEMNLPKLIYLGSNKAEIWTETIQLQNEHLPNCAYEIDREGKVGENFRGEKQYMQRCTGYESKSCLRNCKDSVCPQRRVGTIQWLGPRLGRRKGVRSGEQCMGVRFYLRQEHQGWSKEDLVKYLGNKVT